MQKNGENKSSLNFLKNKNRHDVLELLRISGPMPIADLAERTGLSKVTVTKCVDYYLGLGLVHSTGKGESTEDGGKRPNIFAFNPGYRSIFCVKVDENHLLAALTNLDGKLIASHTAFYDPSTGLDNLLKSIREAFFLLVKRQEIGVADCLGAVIGFHGVIDPEKGICFTSPHFSHWGTDLPLRDMIRSVLPEELPVHIDNWIHYHAYGEIKAMARKVDRFFMIGTEMEGLAGGLVIDGKMYRGFGSLSGEIGHMVVDTRATADTCACGGKGCFEAAVSPLRILARAGAIMSGGKKAPSGKKKPAREISFAELVAAADSGEPVARSLLDVSAGHFAVALNNIMQVCDPELVIIQGEYASAGEFFMTALTEKIQKVSLPSMHKNIRIEYSTRGDEGTIFGAGRYLADLFFASDG